MTPYDIVMTLYDPPFLKNLGIKVEKQLTLVKHAKVKALLTRQSDLLNN